MGQIHWKIFSSIYVLWIFTILPFDCDRVVANFLFFLNLFFRIHLFESCWDVPFCPGILYHTFSRIAGLFQHLNKFYQQQKKVDWISHRMAYLVFWFTTCKFHFLGLKVLRILGKKLKKTHFDAELKNYSLDLIKNFYLMCVILLPMTGRKIFTIEQREHVQKSDVPHSPCPE